MPSRVRTFPAADVFSAMGIVNQSVNLVSPQIWGGRSLPMRLKIGQWPIGLPAKVLGQAGRPMRKGGSDNKPGK